MTPASKDVFPVDPQRFALPRLKATPAASVTTVFTGEGFSFRAPSVRA